MVAILAPPLNCARELTDIITNAFILKRKGVNIMGQYLHPVEVIEENARPIEFKDTFGQTIDQLNPGEKACIVASGPGGRKIALVLNGENDFRAVKLEPERLIAVYAIKSVLFEVAAKS